MIGGYADAPTGRDAMPLEENYGIATLHWSQAGGLSDITCTQAFRYPVSDEDDPDAAADAIESYFSAGGLPCNASSMIADWTWLGVTVLAMTSAGVLVAGAAPASIVGTRPSTVEPVPAYTPMVVTKRTAFSGVQYRGRMYPPYTYNASVAIAPNGTITGDLSDTRDLWESAYALWIAGTYYPVLLHNPPLVGATPPPTQVTSVFLQGVLAIQRRRKERA